MIEMFGLQVKIPRTTHGLEIRTGYHVHSLVVQIKPRQRPLFCRSNKNVGPEHEDDILMQKAMQEAAEIYIQASSMARMQTLQELMQTSMSDSPNDASPALDGRALESFWVEQGLSRAASAALVRDIFQRGQFFSYEQLSAKIQRWRRVLPELEIAEVVAKDTGLLDADVSLGVSNMIILVSMFPGKDLMGMIKKQPRILWASDIQDRFKRVIAKLKQLHPSQDERVVKDIVAENPELLFRMDYYMGATLVDDLPVEIQNMMVLADQGIGFLYKYYRNKNPSLSADGFVV